MGRDDGGRERAVVGGVALVNAEIWPRSRIDAGRL